MKLDKFAYTKTVKRENGKRCPQLIVTCEITGILQRDGISLNEHIKRSK